MGEPRPLRCFRCTVATRATRKGQLPYSCHTHPAKDQLFPIQHAEALRDDVDEATLVVLNDCGYELPKRVRQQMAEDILNKT